MPTVWEAILVQPAAFVTVTVKVVLALNGGVVVVAVVLPLLHV
jgi:hypothetical protein